MTRTTTDRARGTLEVREGELERAGEMVVSSFSGGLSRPKELRIRPRPKPQEDNRNAK